VKRGKGEDNDECVWLEGVRARNREMLYVPNFSPKFLNRMMWRSTCYSPPSKTLTS